MIFDIVFAAIYSSMTALLLWSRTRVRRFLDMTPLIADEVGLRRYKAFVRVQMYCALVPLVLVPPGVALTLMIVKRHGAVGLAVVLGVNACVFALARSHKRWEDRARSLKVRSETLQAEYRKVSEVWLNKPLPTF